MKKILLLLALSAMFPNAAIAMSANDRRDFRVFYPHKNVVCVAGRRGVSCSNVLPPQCKVSTYDIAPFLPKGEEEK